MVALLFVFAGLPVLRAQSAINNQAPVGTWTDQLYWRQIIDVATAEGESVFAATPRGVFRTDPDGAVSRISTSEGLHGADVQAIAYVEDYDALIIGYSTGFVDVWTAGEALAFPDIAESNILADKAISRVISSSHAVLLCTGFGVVQMNLERMEVADTWTLGSTLERLAVRAVVADGDDWLVATSGGLFRAPRNHAFLGDPASWVAVTGPGSDLIDLVRLQDGTLVALEDAGPADAIWVQFPGATSWLNIMEGAEENIISLATDGALLVAALTNDIQLFDSSFEPTTRVGPVEQVYLKPNRLAFDGQGGLWVANNYSGLLYAGLDSARPDAGPYAPAGPRTNSCVRVEAWNDNVWLATGGMDAAGTPLYIREGFSSHVAGAWRNIGPPTGEVAVEGVADPVDVTINPLAPEHVVYASLEEGLVEIENGVIVHYLNPNNSGLGWNEQWADERCTVRGVDFDRLGNLWLVNEGTEHPLKCRSGGLWTDLEVEGLNEQSEVRGIMASWGGQVWVSLRGGGLLLYETSGTPVDRSDDDWRFLTTAVGQGGLPSMSVLSMTEDLDGEVWVGTESGPAVFYQPGSMFTEAPIDAQQLLILQDGNYQYLLETETVQSIAIDGGNRKWLSTQSGAFLIAADGLSQIGHFTAENSSLLDNDVYDTAIDHASGTVYFATRAGVIAFRGSATNFVEEMDALHCFPNPLHPSDPVQVTVDGLAYGSQIRITTVDGRLIQSLWSEGGRAVWDTRDISGRLVPEGVYLIFAGQSIATGSGGVGSATTSKILILR